MIEPDEFPYLDSTPYSSAEEKYFNAYPKPRRVERSKVRKLKPATRMKRNAVHSPRKKPKLDVGGLATETDWLSMSALCRARPPGGLGNWSGGKFTLLRPGKCERCGDRWATDAHHRVLQSQGGPDVLSNLSALCRRCHGWVHTHRVESELAGFIVPSWQDFRVKAFTMYDGTIRLADDEGGYAFTGSMGG